MLHKCHETFQQLGAINYHNLISDLCRKLRISAGDRDGRRGGGGPTRGRGGRHATSEPDGQNSTVVRPDSPMTKASDESFRRKLQTKAWDEGLGWGARLRPLLPSAARIASKSPARALRRPWGRRVIARSHRASKDARSHPGNERSPAFPRDRIAVARPEGRPSRDAL